jgi:hypothetical protein
MDEKKKDWIISIGLNMTILAFPFLISLVYNEGISKKTMTIAVAMYLMTVAIGSTEKILFYLFLITSFFLVATYGAIPNEAKLDGIWCYQFVLAFFATVALGFDKYDLHVRQGQPLNHF